MHIGSGRTNGRDDHGYDYNVIVVGAWLSLGEHCAGELAEGGLRVAVVERQLVGGECSYWACIPSKTLLLTHVGEYQGEVVAANILGEREANYEAVPDIVCTNPQAAAFTATVALSDVAKTATYTHAYAESTGFLTLLSDGDRLTGAYGLGPEAGEWMQQATLAVQARVLRDVIQPFPTFSEIYLAALKALHGRIAAGAVPR